MKVKIIWERTRDGECEVTEYEGNYKEINGLGNITFSEAENDVKHLLKISEEALHWTRSTDIGGKSFSNNLKFGEGVTDKTEYVTPHGIIIMEAETKSYNLERHKENGLPTLKLRYVIKHMGETVSDYEVVIRIVTC